jgi:rhodanese-related sulfurtransferase
MKKWLILGVVAVIGPLGVWLLNRSADEGIQEPEIEEMEVITNPQKISAEEARELMTGGAVWTLLDVRTTEEFAEAHIAGAVLLPDYEIWERARAVVKDKDAPVLVYCLSGGRSDVAARTLVDMGYTKVYDMGGIIDWPYETVNGVL